MYLCLLTGMIGRNSLSTSMCFGEVGFFKSASFMGNMVSALSTNSILSFVISNSVSMYLCDAVALLFFVDTPLTYGCRNFILCLPSFDTKLAGTFFTPSGWKAPAARGFLGEFRGIARWQRRFLIFKIRRRRPKSLSAPVHFTPPEHFDKSFVLRLLLDPNAVSKGKYHAAVKPPASDPLWLFRKSVGGAHAFRTGGPRVFAAMEGTLPVVLTVVIRRAREWPLSP